MDVKKMSEFTCCKCNITYDKSPYEEWSDFDSAEEMLTLYPETKNDPTDVLCDDCNELFKAWFSKFSDEEKKQMREDWKKII
jgi:hypothetical protein